MNTILTAALLLVLLLPLLVAGYFAWALLSQEAPKAMSFGRQRDPAPEFPQEIEGFLHMRAWGDAVGAPGTRDQPAVWPVEGQTLFDPECLLALRETETGELVGGFVAARKQGRWVGMYRVKALRWIPLKGEETGRVTQGVDLVFSHACPYTVFEYLRENPLPPGDSCAFEDALPPLPNA